MAERGRALRLELARGDRRLAGQHPEPVRARVGAKRCESSGHVTGEVEGVAHVRDTEEHNALPRDYPRPEVLAEERARQRPGPKTSEARATATRTSPRRPAAKRSSERRARISPFREHEAKGVSSFIGCPWVRP